MFYRPTTGELVYSSDNTSASSKTFVIPHPTDATKYLVHACLEGPEAGVYYRGRGTIQDETGTCDILLPHYTSSLANEWTIQLTSILQPGTSPAANVSLQTSDVVNDRFTVYGPPGSAFFWLVHGRRSHVDVEPRKDTVTVCGTGPYTWIS